MMVEDRRVAEVPTNVVNGQPICPFCGCPDSDVTHSYPWMNGKRRRRRVCNNDLCRLSFFTVQDAESVE